MIISKISVSASSIFLIIYGMDLLYHKIKIESGEKAAMQKHTRVLARGILGRNNGDISKSANIASPPL
ncbi:MAG: hypothetical protein EVJ47_09165 [Candidatus Acidulodesulfobacterium ferriphilum]|uniref:Uncharacterized protein n=1 Tax=Candidatus Acidulodesulfobacterium ferriphilum TaxID=2597223 RepID=A0A519B955_9DELT|nr:MAG: hypothetical protein EVJ47_09165 [Candidatus Acidulodesulfobacterium ferriphilum]